MSWFKALLEDTTPKKKCVRPHSRVYWDLFGLVLQACTLIAVQPMVIESCRVSYFFFRPLEKVGLFSTDYWQISGLPTPSSTARHVTSCFLLCASELKLAVIPVSYQEINVSLFQRVYRSVCFVQWDIISSVAIVRRRPAGDGWP